MAIAVIMPRQGQSVESCIITEWHKQVGDTVREGDPLFTYETDKATFEETAKASGTLLARFYDVDDDVPCLLNVAVIGTPGEDISEFNPNAAAAPTDAAPASDAPVTAVEAAPPAVSAPASPEAAEPAAAVSPRARAAAERLGVQADYAAPTGPHGRVIERDVIALANSGARATAAALAAGVPVQGGTGIGGRFSTTDIAAYVQPGAVAAAATVSVPATAAAVPVPSAADYEDVKLTNIRKSIARSMHNSLASMAQLTHSSSFDASAILALRKQLKAAPEQLGLPNITLNDILLYACSRVLPRHRDLNAHFLEDKMRYFHHVHLGMAVDTPRGLLVPTLFNADLKSLREIAEESKALAKAAQEGSISPDLLTGATFTISNLGALGVESFTPVINPPQTAILGVCSIVERVRSVDGQLRAYPAMGLSLTYDHRAVDGAPAARFAQDLSTVLESFNSLLVG